MWDSDRSVQFESHCFTTNTALHDERDLFQQSGVCNGSPGNRSPKADQLLKASLHDSDLQVQLNAVHGLAKTHNVPGVTIGLQEFSDHRETNVRNFSKLGGPPTVN